MAPAVFRSKAPIAMPKHADPGQVEPGPEHRAQHAVGGQGGVLAVAQDQLTEQERDDRLAITISTASDPASTITFAHSTGSRRGTAAKVLRIIPFAYSLLMNSTPRMPTISWVSVDAGQADGRRIGAGERPPPAAAAAACGVDRAGRDRGGQRAERDHQHGGGAGHDRSTSARIGA